MILIPLPTLAVLLFLSIGLSYVITGSVIGYWPRVIGWLLLHRIRLHRLVTCPSCNAWWCGLALGWFFGLPLEQWFQTAFASCGVAAIVEAQWHLAASEDFAKMFSNKTGNDPGQKEQGR